MAGLEQARRIDEFATPERPRLAARDTAKVARPA
jgi:hypothetical protein